MPILTLQAPEATPARFTHELERLKEEGSALVVPQASFRVVTDCQGRKALYFGLLDGLGLFTPDRSTELGGTLHLPDMPAHLDPHPANSLKVQATTRGRALAHFTVDVPPGLLDETNELPGNDYEAAGLTPDTVELSAGDVVCFYGSTTLHGFASVEPREALINSYSPII